MFCLNGICELPPVGDLSFSSCSNPTINIDSLRYEPYWDLTSPAIGQKDIIEMESSDLQMLIIKVNFDVLISEVGYFCFPPKHRISKLYLEFGTF